MLEAADRPGGAVRTEQLTLPGFRHDIFSSVYPAGVASPVFARMPLERHGLRWIHPGACYAHPLPGGRAVALYRDLDRTEASLDAVHPGDGQRWRTFVAPMLDEFEAIRATMLGGFPPVAAALRLPLALGPLGTARFAALLPGSARGLASRLFGGTGSRAWLYGSAGHGDVPPTDAGSAIAAVYLNLMGHAVGWPSPAGGAERLTEALVAYLRERGGEVRTAALVDEIEAAHGRVTGVRIAGGERVAAELVIADVMPHALAALAGEALPSGYRSLLRRYRYGPATVKVDWALDGPIPWEAPEPRAAGTVHVAGEEADIMEAIARSQSGLPDRPFLLLGQQSLADPSRAPAGKHTAWAYTHGPRTGVDWSARGRAARRPHRGAGRAVRARVSRADPRTPCARPRRFRAPRPQPRARRRRRRQLPPAPGRVPAGPRSVALPDAAARSLPRAAPRPSPVAPSTACPATPPRGRRSPTRG